MAKRVGAINTKGRKRTMELHFTKAKEEDSEEILSLYRSAIGREGSTWTMEYPSSDTLLDDLQRESLFCLKDLGGKIIGAISIDKDDLVNALPCWNQELMPGGELARLVVRKGYENQGIARVLLKNAMEQLRKRNYKSVLFLVSKKNERALRSYAKFNFNKMGECDLYDGDWWCYQKEL